MNQPQQAEPEWTYDINGAERDFYYKGQQMSTQAILAALNAKPVPGPTPAPAATPCTCVTGALSGFQNHDPGCPMFEKAPEPASMEDEARKCAIEFKHRFALSLRSENKARELILSLLTRVTAPLREEIDSAKRDANEWFGKWERNEVENVNLRGELERWKRRAEEKQKPTRVLAEELAASRAECETLRAALHNPTIYHSLDADLATVRSTAAARIDEANEARSKAVAECEELTKERDDLFALAYPPCPECGCEDRNESDMTLKCECPAPLPSNALIADLDRLKAECEELRKERNAYKRGCESAKRDANEWYGKWELNQTEKINLRAEVARLTALTQKGPTT